MITPAPTSKGLAYSNGTLFFYSADATLIALNASTGKVIWKVSNLVSDQTQLGTNSPTVANGKVIVGISGTGKKQQHRGYLSAFDVDDGTLLWRAYTTGPDSDLLVDPDKTTTWENGKTVPVGKDSSLKSWQNDQWQSGGGNPSGWFTIDEKRNLIYYGTSAPKPWKAKERPGDNRWTSALWARDIDTGIAKWVYQLTPHDQWGYSSTHQSTLIERTINGEQTPVLVHFDENGFVYQLNRDTGALISADKVHESTNWATKIDLYTGKPILNKAVAEKVAARKTMFCPTIHSSGVIQTESYSKKNKLFYSAGNYLCYVKGMNNLLIIKGLRNEYEQGNEYKHPPLPDYINNLTAWDSEKQQIAWENRELGSVTSGILTTAGDVVIYGSRDGYFIVSNAKTGGELYRFKGSSGISSQPVTWQYKGKQYISVIAGLLSPEDGIPSCQTTSHTGLYGPHTTLDYHTTLCLQNEEGVLMVFTLDEI